MTNNPPMLITVTLIDYLLVKHRLSVMTEIYYQLSMSILVFNTTAPL